MNTRNIMPKTLPELSLDDLLSFDESYPIYDNDYLDYDVAEDMSEISYIDTYIDADKYYNSYEKPLRKYDSSIEFYNDEFEYSEPELNLIRVKIVTEFTSLDGNLNTMEVILDPHSEELFKYIDKFDTGNDTQDIIDKLRFEDFNIFRTLYETKGRFWKKTTEKVGVMTMKFSVIEIPMGLEDPDEWLKQISSEWS